MTATTIVDLRIVLARFAFILFGFNDVFEIFSEL